jgi:ABC-type phosphate transport system permease subunit
MEGDRDGVRRVNRAGVITGVLLAVARISGETAPLLFTSLNNQFDDRSQRADGQSAGSSSSSR